MICHKKGVANRLGRSIIQYCYFNPFKIYECVPVFYGHPVWAMCRIFFKTKSIQYKELNTRNEEATITIGERRMMCELE